MKAIMFLMQCDVRKECYRDLMVKKYALFSIFIQWNQAFIKI